MTKSNKEIMWGLWHPRHGFDYNFNEQKSSAKIRLIHSPEKGWKVVQVEVREINPKKTVQKREYSKIKEQP